MAAVGCDAICTICGCGVRQIPANMTKPRSGKNLRLHKSFTTLYLDSRKYSCRKLVLSVSSSAHRMAQPLQPSSQAMQSTQNTGFLQPNGACCAHCRHNQTSAVASIRSESETVHPDAPGNSQWNHHDFSPASWKERFAMRIHHFTFAWYDKTKTRMSIVY